MRTADTSPSPLAAGTRQYARKPPPPPGERCVNTRRAASTSSGPAACELDRDRCASDAPLARFCANEGSPAPKLAPMAGDASVAALAGMPRRWAHWLCVIQVFSGSSMWRNCMHPGHGDVIHLSAAVDSRS